MRVIRGLDSETHPLRIRVTVASYQVSPQILERTPSVPASQTRRLSGLPHYQTFDVVLLGEGKKFLKYATDQVFAHLHQKT